VSCIPHPRRNAEPQNGFALIVGLMLLIVMSLIGVTMMNVTHLETLMAGGARESNIAFQAAEAALRDAEAAIDAATSISNDFDGTTVGQLSETDVEPDFCAAATWTASAGNSRAYASGDYPEVLTQPRYIIKHVGNIIDDAAARQAISVIGYGGASPRPTVSIFRITARGTSRDGSATTMLQSYYSRAF